VELGCGALVRPVICPKDSDPLFPTRIRASFFRRMGDTPRYRKVGILPAQTGVCFVSRLWVEAARPPGRDSCRGVTLYEGQTCVTDKAGSVMLPGPGLVEDGMPADPSGLILTS
jgi:hypothetical protein